MQSAGRTDQTHGIAGLSGSSPDAPPHAGGSIVTPEAVLLDFELAGVPSRSLAYAIDFFVQLMALLVLMLVVGLGAMASEVAAIVVLLVGAIVIVIGYPVGWETMNNGRSIGRMVVGTQVVTVEGGPVRFRHALVRALIGIVDLLLSSGAIAVSTALVTRRGQRLGDLAAGTMVIRSRTGSPTATSHQFWVPRYLVPWAQAMDTSGVTEADYQLMRDFLTRPELGQSPAATELVAHIESRVPRWPRPGGATASDYLRAVASMTQADHGVAVPPPPVISPPPNRGTAAPPVTMRSPLPPPPGFPATPAAPPTYVSPAAPASAPPVPAPEAPPAAPDPPPSNEPFNPNGGGFTAPG